MKGEDYTRAVTAGAPTKIDIGGYSISTRADFGKDYIWLENELGEGMQVWVFDLTPKLNEFWEEFF